MNSTIRAQPTFLHVLLAGPFSLGDAKQNFVDITAAVAQNHSGKVLLDGRAVTGDPTIVERFYYSEFAANTVQQRLKEEAHDPGPQFAYVLHEPVLDPHRFGETVALNRGMHVKVFDDFDEAIEWLGLSAEDL